MTNTEQKQTKQQRAAQIAANLNHLQIAAIHSALRSIAGVCDGANKLDGVGFNGTDADFGASLAACRSLSVKQAAYGYLMLKKYRRQISAENWSAIYGNTEAKPINEGLKAVKKIKVRLYLCVGDCGKAVALDHDGCKTAQGVSCLECLSYVTAQPFSVVYDSALGNEAELVRKMQADYEEDARLEAMYQRHMQDARQIDAWGLIGLK